MRLHSCITLATGVLLGLTVHAQDDTKKDALKDEVKKEMERLQGAWQAVSAEHYGEKAPEDRVKSIKIVFKDDTLTLRQAAKYKVDPARKPKTIDVTPTDGPDKDKTIEGIYELKGDELTLCMAPPGGPRPTELTTKPGSATALFVLKKAKSEK